MLRHGCLALFALAFTICHAWYERGHEQVADVAWTLLSTDTKTELGAILKAGDTDCRPASDSESDVRAAFRKAAVWADWVKSHTDGQYEPEIKVWNAMFQPGFEDTDTDREAVRCKRWHYFDVPIRYKGAKPGVEPSNALIAMTTARYEFSILAREPVKDRKSQCWWLYWLEHVIGDLHQPLHCVSSFEFEPTGDAGGNLFKLGIGTAEHPDRKINLHSLWDQGVERALELEPLMPSDVESVTARWMAANKPTQEELDKIQFSQWIADGAKLAEIAAYEGIQRDGVPSKDYLAREATIVKKQIVLAGYRLAAELEKGLGTAAGHD